MATSQMADVEPMYAEQIEAARQALSRGDRPAAAAAFHSAISMARGESALQRELVTALVQLGKLEQELGHPGDAERLLLEALATAERQLGPDHVSLGPVLNELSRLHIRQSEHARAEAVLERLLRITRTRGEEHPDVATALTGLGLVKRALGDDVAAEQRFRDALRIREKSLAPEHMATVVTIEQLAETCAVRGKVDEALALLRRALPTRETALGAEHATVRALRSRIAALELRVATCAAEAAAEMRRVAPVAASAAEAPTAVPVPETAFVPAAAFVPTHAASAAPEDTAAPIDLALPASSARRSRRRVVRLASVGVAAAILATAGIAVGARAGGGHDRATTTASAGTETASTDAAAPPTNSAVTLGVAAVTRADSLRSASETPTVDASAKAPAPESAPLHVPPRLPVVSKSLAAVTARLMAKTNVDSLVRASTKVGREFLTDQIGPAGGLQTSSHLDDTGAHPATLAGPAPVPHFPDELRSHWTDGEVVLRFRVDERGHVDLSSVKVLKSDHDLFTAAVRSVLPRFHFEPARSAAPQSKAISDWVDYRVQFAAAK